MAKNTDDPIYLASIYRITAVNFQESAKTLGATIETDSDGVPRKITAIPFYFLVSHAAELLLKSALLKRGFTNEDLRRFDYRHNLDALLQELQGKGVAVSGDTIDLINGLHSQHHRHALSTPAALSSGAREAAG